VRKVEIKTAFDCTLPGETVSRMHYKGEVLELDDEPAKSAVKSGAGVYVDEAPALAPAPEPEEAADPEE
jgi:hypothetical protein